MKNNLNELIEISEYLDDIDSASTLNKMRDVLESGNYILTVMGQFSAGKSTLINALLGRNILPVNKTETTAIVTYIKYGNEDHAELVYSDGRTEECSIEETMKLEQNGESLEKVEQLDAINIYVSCDLLKNGLIIADTPGVNTVLKEHIEKTAQLFETSSRIMYVVSGSMSMFDKDFLKTLQDKGLRSLVVRTYMDAIYCDEEDPNETINSENELIKEYTDEPVFFTSSKEESSFYKNIAELRSYILKNISQLVSQQLEEAVDERAGYIAQRLIPLIKQRENAVSAMLENNENEYEKQRQELEIQGANLRKALENSRKKLESRYSSLKNEADSDLKEKARVEIRNLSESIHTIDFTAPMDVKTSIEDMIRKSCTNLRTAYVSNFDQIIKENKEEILTELNENGLSVYLNVNLPDSIDEAGESVSEIEDKIEALITLQEALDAEIEDSKNRIAADEEQQRQIEAETEMTNEAVEALRRELSDYGEYVERYRIKHGSHKNEQRMRTIGRIADFATILIPGETWVKIGGKVLSGTKIAAEGAKVIKGADTAADVIRGLHMIKKNGMAEKNGIALPCEDVDESTEDYSELQQRLQEHEGQPGLLDLLSLEFYFSKIGKKFDVPDTIVIDEEHKQRYEAGRKEIVDRISAESRKAADDRIKIGKITDKKEQEEIFIKEQNKRKAKADKEISELNRKLEKAKTDQVNEVSARYYISAMTSYIEDFCSHIAESVMPAINEKFESYIETYGLEMESEIARQQNALEELKQEFSNASNDKLKDELEKCRAYSAIVCRMTN